MSLVEQEALFTLPARARAALTSGCFFLMCLLRRSLRENVTEQYSHGMLERPLRPPDCE